MTKMGQACGVRSLFQQRSREEQDCKDHEAATEAFFHNTFKISYVYMGTDLEIAWLSRSTIHVP
jgi:hypothetical protein